jgi:REP element-mobilizing transposase RayT
MGELEANRDMVTRHDLRHDRHTVSLLTDHLVFSPKYRGKVLEGEVAEAAEEISWIAKRIKGRSSKLLRDRFPQLGEWCPGQFYADFPKGNQILQSKIGQYWAPSCYQKTFKKSFIKNASQSVGHGWEVVERYISGQKGYEKTDTVPVIVEEKPKIHKTWYTSLYNKLFGGKHQK